VSTPSTSATRRWSCASLTPSAASSEMLVAVCGSPRSLVCAVSVSKKTSAAPGLVVVNVAMPTTSALNEPGAAMMVSVSPIATSLLSAVSASIRT
jgi:hypothetical protein